MNISIKLPALAFMAVMSITSISCTEKKYAKYQCPMKCEKEKTYDKVGKCPLCEMTLIGIDSTLIKS